MHRIGDLLLVMMALVMNADRFLAGTVNLLAGVLMVCTVVALCLCTGSNEDDQSYGTGCRDTGFKL